MWKTLNEVRIADILQFVRDASRDGQSVHVGTHQAGELGGTHAADHVVRSHGKLPRTIPAA